MLEITDLQKSFGDKTVLAGLNLSVLDNSIFGFIGKNGAGKTTTMKIDWDFFKRTSEKFSSQGKRLYTAVRQLIDI